MIRNVFVLWMVFFFSTLCVAQITYTSEEIKFNQGLPSDYIYGTIKKDGNLYIASQRGLCLYDGYQFIKHPQVNSLTNYLFVKGSYLYFYTSNLGLVRTQNSKDTLHLLGKVNFTDSIPTNDHFENIYVDQDNRVWSTDQNNIKYYSPEEKKIISYRFDSSLSESGMKNTFLVPNTNELWIATRKGLYLWDKRTKTVGYHSDFNLRNEHFISACLSEDKRFLCYTTNKGALYSYDLQRQTRSKATFFGAKNEMVSLVPDFENEDDSLLLYSSKTLYVYNKTQKTSQIIYSSMGIINHVFFDKETQLLWLSTNRGLIKLIPNNSSIETLKVPQTIPKTTQSIVQDKNSQLWISNGTNSVYKYNAKSNWKTISYPDPTLHFTELFAYNNDVLIASNRGVFIVQNDKLSLLLRTKFEIKKVIVDYQHQLWLLPNKGPIQVYDYFTRKEKVDAIANSSKYWSTNKFNDIALANDGSVWVASWMPKDYGISYFSPKTKYLTEISQIKEYKNESLFVSDYFNKIAFTRNSNVLFSGYGGWNLVNKKGQISYSFHTEKYNVANDHIEGIAEDRKGNIWFASAEGLYQFNFRTNKAVRISQIDGLASDDLVYGFCKLVGNKIALGTDFGCQIVDLDKIVKTQLVNKLQLTAVKKDGKFFPHNGHSIAIDYDFTQLEFFFSALSFSEKEKIIYRYKFDSDGKWNYLGTNPKLSLIKLSPGNYTVTIEVGDNIGNWQAHKLHLSITIRPPFYLTYWFMAIVVLLIIAVAYLVNRYFINQEKIKGDLKTDIKEAEMQTLRSQMNPHFMFNSLNSINSYIIQNKSSEASKYLTTFSRLMRNILDLSKQRTIPVDKEIKTLDWYLQLEAVRLEHKFTYSIECSEAIDAEIVQIPPLIIQPFVENAIWHGIQNKKDTGTISVSIDLDVHQNLCITIVDDGIGRQASALLKKNQTNHKSYGIDITIHRLQMLHPTNSVEIIDLYDDVHQAKGTQVVLTISC